MRTRAHFTEPHLVALDKKFHAEDAQPGRLAVKADTEVVRHGFRDVAASLQGRIAHRVRLPAFHIITGYLHMADGLTKMRFDLAVSAQRTHRQLCDLVVEINKTFDDDAAARHAATGHRVVPRGFHIGRAGNLALALAG